jgi:hypothetical protein
MNERNEDLKEWDDYDNFTTDSQAVTMQKKKDHARLIFLTEPNTFQKDIAKRVGTSVVTMSKWVNTEGWEKVRFDADFEKRENIKKLLIQLKDHNDSIMNREEGLRSPTSKEMDVTIKLTGAIKNLQSERTIPQVVDVMKDYFDWLRSRDLDESKRQLPTVDSYIKSLYATNR